MALLQTQPNWWRAAQARGLVSGDADSPADAHEPGAILIALSMLGALACLVPLAAFFVLVLGEHFVSGMGGFVTGVVVLAAGGALLRATPQPFLNCMAMVLWGLGTGLVVVSIGSSLPSSRTWQALACAIVAALMLLGTRLAHTRWIAAVMGVVFAGAVYGFVVTVLSMVLWLELLSFAGLLLAGLWWQWLRTEPQRLAQPGKPLADPRWAAFADAAAVGVLAVVSTGAVNGSWCKGVCWAGRAMAFPWNGWCAPWHWWRYWRLQACCCANGAAVQWPMRACRGWCC